MTIYQQIYKIVEAIPPGKVMSYGQISGMLTKCTPRMVGYAMSAVPEEKETPWWRVVNSQLKISIRTAGAHHLLQKKLLEEEGVAFDKNGKIDEAFRFV